MRLIDEDALERIAIGSTILGAGGGGDPYIGKLLAREEIRRHGPVQGEGAWKRLLPAIVDDITAAPQLSFEDLRRIRLPVLLVYGDRDVFVPVDHAVSIYRHMPDARLLIAPNSPHTVMVAQPALFNQAAANFYRSTEQVAIKRASAHDGAPEYEPSAVAVADADGVSDPFSKW